MESVEPAGQSPGMEGSLLRPTEREREEQVLNKYEVERSSRMLYHGRVEQLQWDVERKKQMHALIKQFPFNGRACLQKSEN